MRKSEWYGIRICAVCYSRLSDNEVMYNIGVCPVCGTASKGTALDALTVVVREIKHHPWYKFWDRKVTYEGVDEFSQDWLAKSE